MYVVANEAPLGLPSKPTLRPCRLPSCLGQMGGSERCKVLFKKIGKRRLCSPFLERRLVRHLFDERGSSYGRLLETPTLSYPPSNLDERVMGRACEARVGARGLSVGGFCSLQGVLYTDLSFANATGLAGAEGSETVP